MQINKKVLLSILTIGMLACVASAGTWAYFQDTITSSGNGISIGDIQLWVNDIRGGSDNSVTITGNMLENIIPDPMVGGSDGGIYTPNREINTFKVENRGSIRGRLYIQVIPRVETLGVGSNERVKLMIGVAGASPTTIYDNGDNIVSDVTYVTYIDPDSSKDISLMSNFPDDGHNQNNLEGKELRFDLVFILKNK